MENLPLDFLSVNLLGPEFIAGPGESQEIGVRCPIWLFLCNALFIIFLLEVKKEESLPPRVYSHSLGYFLHEPGPLIGLPWEQVNNPGREVMRLVPDSCFTLESSVIMPLPEWGDQDFRLSFEPDIVFTGERCRLT